MTWHSGSRFEPILVMLQFLLPWKFGLVRIDVAHDILLGSRTPHFPPRVKGTRRNQNVKLGCSDFGTRDGAGSLDPMVTGEN